MSESLFCWKQIYISHSVGCDTLQDQLVLGSCIVGYNIGYDLKSQSISIEHPCVKCVRQKKTILCNNTSVNGYALCGSRVQVPGLKEAAASA